MNLHAHIYYPLEQKPIAVEIHSSIASHLAGQFTFLSELNEGPLGPHPLPSFEVHFQEEHLPRLRSFFETHRRGLSVLIHRDTGNDPLDHRENIEWHGNPVPLDFGFFDLILRHPELRIHK